MMRVTLREGDKKIEVFEGHRALNKRIVVQKY